MQRLTRYSQGLQIGRRFAVDLVPHSWRLVRIALVSLGLIALQLLRPWPIQWIFDGALVPVGEPSMSFARVVWTGVAAAAAIALAQATVQYARDIALADVGHRVTRGMRFRIFQHLGRLSPLFHARYKSGDLLVRLMGDVPMVTTMLVDSSVEVAARLVLVLGTAAVMAVLDPLLTLFVFAALPLLALVVRWISAQIRVAVRKQRRKEGDLADYMHEAIAATETIQSLGGSEHVVRRFARGNRRSARAGLKAKRLSARLTASVESILGVVLAGALAAGSLRVLRGTLTPGELLVFLSYVRSIIKPLRSASKHAARIAKGTACGERILTILDEDIGVESAPDAEPAPLHPRELAFERVSFRYGGGSRALVDFSARFGRGELAALVGRSGAGKSTAASLALRLFDPDEGQVSLDGVSLDRFELTSLRQRIALCLQRSAFFGESIRENLLLARPDAGDQEIWGALEQAGAAAFVRGLPEELDTTLGAGGVGLSGGQHSRLSLARTLLRSAPVLVVDEPFAGLDRAAARDVADTLRRLARERIVIVIAHDFERLDVYDRIVFMDHGSKVDEGAHEELASRVPLYREVVRTTAEVPA